MAGIARLSIILMLMMAGAAADPAAEPAPASPAYPIYGAWEITRFQTAPWVEHADERKELETDGAAHLHLKIAFAPSEVIAKDPILGCTAANYEPTSFPAQAIFQGNLLEPDQEKIAASLGLPEGDIPGFDLDCSTGLFSYHFANADTLLVALSDVVYWLARQK